MPVEKELDDKEFDDLLAEKRHNQIVDTLRSLSKKDDAELKTVIRDNTELVKRFVTLAENFSNPTIEIPTPQVNVTNDNLQVIASFKAMSEEINKNLLALKQSIDNRPTYSEWTFKVEKKYGSIDTIIATAKK